MAGAGDPDNRRMMQFNGLNTEETKTLETTTKLIALRKTNTALVYGDTQFLLSADKEMAIARTYFNNIAITVFNKGNKAKTIEFTLPQEYAGAELKANFGNEPTKTINKIKVTIPANGFEVLTLK
jgi:glycosidase